MITGSCDPGNVLMEIIFSCLGFTSSEAFIVLDGRQLMIGTIFSKFPGEYEFWTTDFFKEHYVEKWKYVKIEDVPTSEQIIAEYKKQYAEKGVCINNDILYAG